MTDNNGEKKSDWLTDPDAGELATILVGGGVLGTLYLLVKRNQNVFSWLIPLGMIAAGVDLYLKDRQERIKQTGDLIASQLDELDPIARAEVVKYLAEQEMDKIS